MLQSLSSFERASHFHILLHFCLLLNHGIRTRQDVVLPLGTPIKSTDGKTDISAIFLKNNTDVMVGMGAVNRDPEIWGDDAHLWKPERWLGKTTEQVASVRLPGIYSGM
jgi:Cytochrome P450